MKEGFVILVNHGEKAWQQELEAAGYIAFEFMKLREMNAGVSSLSPYSVQDSSLQNSVDHIYNRSSINTIHKHQSPPDMPRVVSPR